MLDDLKKIAAAFYRTSSGGEPVRDWILSLDPADRKIVGVDLASVEYGWPIGMPTCRPLGQGLWEVRSHISDGLIARLMFCIKDGSLILLHGFIKKTQKTPDEALAVARTRQKEIQT